MRTTLLCIAALLASLNLSLATAQSPVAPAPDPRLSPRQVVELQLKALKTVDQPFKDAGFATVWRFTSPENREQTGPLPRFAKMLRTGFGEMINYRSVRLSPLVQQDGRAIQPVELISLAGRSYRYVFILRQQIEGDYEGCWMTDGVVPQDPNDSGSQEL